MLLASGEMPYAFSPLNPPEPTKWGCIGVRQSSGRVARVLMLDDGYQPRIAGAEWVEDVDANWARSGCLALSRLVIAREAEYAATWREKSGYRPRR